MQTYGPVEVAFTESEKECLVRLVKELQKQGAEGDKVRGVEPSSPPPGVFCFSTFASELSLQSYRWEAGRQVPFARQAGGAIQTQLGEAASAASRTAPLERETA